MYKPAKTISIMQLLEMFDTEDKAVAWLENKRWGGKPVCLHCKSTDKVSIAKAKKYTYWCGNCRKHFTVKTGTIMQSSKLPVCKWMVAIYYFMTARKGISSLQLSKELGITQKSAWFMAHKIRAACSGTDFKMEGVVEMDETYIGGKEKNKHKNKKTKRTQGRSTKTKAVVVGVRSRDGKVKAKKMKSVNKETVQEMINENVKKGSVVMTDEARHYTNIKGYEHYMINHSVGEFVRHMAHVNGIESYWAILKRGYHGTFHHFSKKHIDRYVNEFAFRLDEGNCKIDTMDRIGSVVKGCFNKRLTYESLIS